MARTISISPLTRIEGHLAVHTDAEPLAGAIGKEHRVTSAHCEGEMFRGFEQILRGRDPLDAQQIVQRICGVCPISHGIASCQAQEMAYGIKPTPNGRILRNLILGANYLQSDILHFYLLSALDFIDVTAVLKYNGSDRKLRAVRSWVQNGLAQKAQGMSVYPAAPFLPRYEVPYLEDTQINCDFIAHYVEALEVRRIAHEMAAVFGARLPHSTALVPGGCTQAPVEERILTYRSRLKQIQEFVESIYFPDVVAAAKAFPGYWDIGAGYGNLLAYGVFEMDETGNRFYGPGVLMDGKWEALDINRISEEVGYSKFSSPTKLHPAQGQTTADPGKANAYTWLKAPRYNGQPMEVGPLARLLVNYYSPKPGPGVVKKDVDGALQSLGVPDGKMVSVLGRHLARAFEARWLSQQMFKWLDELDMAAPPARDFDIPATGSGYGLVEASRGALGHWITIADHKIKNYECVVPTTWNCSPRDDAGKPGPVEKALEGVVVGDPDQPIEVGRVVRSFDPCLACAVH